MMIRALFLPDRIGSYYLFPQRILGLHITPQAIQATLVRASGRTRVIEKSILRSIEPSAINSYQVQASAALAALFTEIGSYDVIRSTMLGSHVIFKELIVPFTSATKISLILPFEVEQLLPLPISQAAINFVILRQTDGHKKSEILVTAVRLEDLEEHTKLITSAAQMAQRPPKELNISVDVLDLFDLYQQTEDLRSLKGVVAVIHLNHHYSQILLVIDGELRFVRVFNKGLTTWAKTVATSQKREISEFFETFAHANPKDYLESAKSFFEDIIFSLDAALLRISQTRTIETVILAGAAVELKGFQELVSTLLKAPSIAWHTRQALHNATITAQSGLVLADSNLMSVAAALADTFTRDFKLSDPQQTVIEQKFAGYQLLTVALLCGVLFIALTTYTIVQVSMLQYQSSTIQTEAIDKIKKEFKGVKINPSMTLSRANDEARRAVEKEESIWFSLSPAQRASFLTILEEISKHVDAEKLGLQIKRLSISDGILSLEGEVAGFSELRSLEEALNDSHYFKNIPKLQEPKFSIKLTLVNPLKEGL